MEDRADPPYQQFELHVHQPVDKGGKRQPASAKLEAKTGLGAFLNDPYCLISSGYTSRWDSGRVIACLEIVGRDSPARSMACKILSCR